MMYCKNNYDKTERHFELEWIVGGNKPLLSFSLSQWRFVAWQIAPHTVNMIIRAAGFPGA